MNNVINPTRGQGKLEKFLAIQRSKISNNLIPENLRTGSILDIGCGSYPLNLINTIFNHKYGLDRLDNSFDNSFKDYGINLIKFDMEKENKLPFKDNSFEVVTMLAVFEHIEPSKLEENISEIYRVLKKDGVFIMTTPAIWTDKILRAMSKFDLVSKEEIEEHKDAYSPAKILPYLTKSGFNKQSIQFGYFELFMNIWCRSKK